MSTQKAQLNQNTTEMKKAILTTVLILTSAILLAQNKAIITNEQKIT
jgi:hypothetical protein